MFILYCGRMVLIVALTGNCVLDVKAAPGGDSTNVAALELDIIFDGKPTFVPAPATPEGGA